MSREKPLIVITTGDPAGIGPEITEKALRSKSVKDLAEYVIIKRPCGSGVEPGRAHADAGRAAYENIAEAVRLIKGVKRPRALVTAPISKYSLKKAGYRFTAHTEILGHLTGSRRVAMIFSADAFRLALVTRHVPLSKVASVLSAEKICGTTKLFYDALRELFKIRRPRIGIAGLNPHAGESGTMGDDEKRIIMPAVRALQKDLDGIRGPYPADTLFHDLYKRKLDGVVCMYHDQGLVPFKMLFFDEGVNLTLGLPFVRTSPDHGTAFDIAGKGAANPSSMIAAIRMAAKMAR
ncbi:MAG: 4-hydroxythreonine-4-phosphate dehydrogenase PdxA [Candidatus Omnitrophota bacterium]